MLAAPGRCGWQVRRHGTLQERFGAEIGELNVERQRGNELDEAMIEERYARLDRRRHAHAIHLVEDVVDEPGVDVEIHETMDDVLSARGEVLFERVASGLWLVASELGAELRREPRDPLQMALDVTAFGAHVRQSAVVTLAERGETA